MKMDAKKHSITLLLFVLQCIPIISIAKTHYLPHLEQSIALDGLISESVWQKALKIELNYETTPGENIKPSVNTHVYLYEDGETLYVAFDARDDKPESIRDFLLDRDNIWSSDFVGLKFDTFGESRKAFQFFTNARNIQADAIQEDFIGDDASWDAIWESKAKINDNGYIVEMAIPFKALRFPSTGKKQTWGIEVLRFLPRKVFHRIANAPVNRDIACNICQYDQLVGFEKVTESKNLRLIPTLTMGKSENREFNDQSQPSSWSSEDLSSNVGIDLRWGITPETYLNATINPDFSQVEADSAQLEVNSTFSIFVDEKRPFFLDGANYFHSPNRLVHTRDLVSPDYGLKITGQTDNHSYGVISVRDEVTSFLLPSNQGSSLLTLKDTQSENQILRYSYDLGNKNNIGALVTYKAANGYSNKVSSVDGKYWFNDAHSLIYQVMNSESQYSQSMVEDNSEIETAKISDNAFALKYDYQTRNWRAKVRHGSVGKDFRADLGFVRKVDFAKSVIGVRRIWFPQSIENGSNNQWWNRASFGGDWDITKDSNGKLLEKELEANARMQGNYQSSINVGLGKREREWENILFDEDFYFIFAGLEPISSLKLNVRYSWGNSIDFANSQLGESKRVSPAVEWQASQHLLIRLNFSKQWFNVDEGELFNASAANLRMSYLFDERNSLRFTMQKLDTKKNPTLYVSFLNDDLDNEPPKYISLATQLLYSYKVNPQTLFFAGYSDNGFQNDQMEHIEKEKRSVFMKFSYAWQI